MITPMSTDLPLISVVIPCFNYARYVASAIDSVLTQEYPNKELIVVNDGSTDGSAEVIARYSGRLTNVSQENRGSIGAYNRGFSMARGAIVILLDADDVLSPDALADIAKAWYPSCAKVQYDVSIIDAAGADMGRRFCNFTAEYDAAAVRRSFERTGTYRWPITVGNAYSRWFAELMFPLTVPHGPDGALNTVAPIYGDVVTIPEVLASYRVHGANWWSSNGKDNSRLPDRIRDRQGEIALMRTHAERRGVAVSPGNILDYELPFINYRLMAFKLNLNYDGKESDSMFRLVYRGVMAVRRERLTLRHGVPHVLWFLGLWLAPGPAVQPLIRLRFSRGSIFARPRHVLTKLRRLVHQ